MFRSFIPFINDFIPWEDKALKEDAWTLKGLKNKERRIQVSKNYDFKKVTLPRYCSRSLLEEEWTIDHVEHRRWDHITRTCRYFFSPRYLFVCAIFASTLCLV